MTIAFKCSDCGTPLKVADTFAGKKCKCPKCAVINNVPAGAAEEPVEEQAPSSVKKGVVATEPAKGKAGSAAAVAVEPAKGKTKAKAAEVEEEVSEETEEPADGAAEEKDAKPKKKGKGKKDKAKKGSKKGLIIGGVIAALSLGFFACSGCGGGLALWYFGFFGGSDELRYLPNGTKTVSSTRVDQIRNSTLTKETAKKMGLAGLNEVDAASTNAFYGIQQSNIDRTVTGSTGLFTGGDTITVVVANGSVDAADIVSKFKQVNSQAEFTETKVGSYKMMERKNSPDAFCVVGRKTVIYGQTKTVRAVLERDKPPELSAAMQAALKRADFSNSMTSVVDLSGKGDTGAFGVKSIESIINETHYGSDITTRKTLICKEGTDIEAAKKETEAQIAREKAGPFGNLAGNVTPKVSTSGNAVIVETHVSIEAALQNVQKFQFK